MSTTSAADFLISFCKLGGNGFSQVGASLSTDAPGGACGRSAMLPVRSAVTQRLQSSAGGLHLSGSNFSELRADKVRLVTHFDAQGSGWSAIYGPGGLRIENFVDHLGGTRSLVIPGRVAAPSNAGICLECLKAAAAAGSTSVARG
jgi:hypothetical protein